MSVFFPVAPSASWESGGEDDPSELISPGSLDLDADGSEDEDGRGGASGRVSLYSDVFVNARCPADEEASR